MEEYKTDHLFLKGPLKFDWLSRAYRSGPNSGALAVAELIIIKLDIQKGEQPVFIPSRMYRKFGLERGAFQRALRALKSAHLISFTPINGRSHRITVLPGYRHTGKKGEG